MLTQRELEEALPSHLRHNATPALLDMVNNISADPEVAEQIRDNFLSYSGVLREGKFKTEDYLNAVAYVSYKIMGMSNQDAYARAFPQRYAALTAKGASQKDISAYVHAYSKGRLVNMIMEQTLVPTWVLNHDVYQKAINTQAMLMMTAKSEKVRADAANSILTHLKRPEKQQVELNIGVAETSGMKELKDMLTSLAERQQAAIEAGVQTKEIAHQKLISSPDVIDAEVIKDDE